MKVTVRFSQSENLFKPKFREVDNISDGGYERGYESGFVDGVASVANYLPCSSTARFGNLNLFGRSDVIINMPLLSTAASMFRRAAHTAEYLNRTVEHITINSESQPESVAEMFYQVNLLDSQDVLTHITINFDTSKATAAYNMFAGVVNLEIVDGKPLNLSSVTADTTNLYVGSKLSYIRFVPNSIKKSLNVSGSKSLTSESVQSIIDGLVNVKGQTTQRVMFHQDVVNRLTAEQILAIQSKNWTYVSV